MKKAAAPKDLKAQVAERQSFLETVIKTVEFFLEKRGRVYDRQVHSAHTSQKVELDNFHGFSFYSYGSYTMFGGEEIKIWYHPGKKEHPPLPVLEIQWWELKELHVKHFDDSPEWQKAILLLAKDKATAVKQAAREEAKRKKAADALARRKAAANISTVETEKAAKRLGLQ